MKKFLYYTALAALIISLAACGISDRPEEPEPPDPALEEIGEKTLDPEETAKKMEAILPPFAAAFDEAAELVADAAADFVPPVRCEDGTLFLPYETLVERYAVPETEAAMQQWFGNTLFIGDSRTVGMAQFSGLTGADFFALTGMSVFDAFKSEVDLRQDGQKTTLEALLQNKKYDRIYLMLGINELGYSLSSIEKKYEEVTARVKELQPQAHLWLQANMHVTQGRSDKDPTFNNNTINALNAVIHDISLRQETGWLDINPVFDDANGHLDIDYTFDHTHIVGKHYKYWALWIYLQSADQSGLPV